MSKRPHLFQRRDASARPSQPERVSRPCRRALRRRLRVATSVRHTLDVRRAKPGLLLSKGIMTAPRLRVLVVDDSAFARKVLREVLGAHPQIEVIGFARDGLEALESIAELRPDVITLDLVMPNLDGLGVLRELKSAGTSSRVVVVSISDEDSELVVEALQLGAVELVRKPTALATDRLYDLSGPLIRAVTNAGAARSPVEQPSKPVPARVSTKRASVKAVVLGTSTGGPQALTRVLSTLPADLPVPVVVALHIPG